MIVSNCFLKHLAFMLGGLKNKLASFQEVLSKQHLPYV